MLEAAEAGSRAPKPVFVHVKARQAFPGNLAAKFVDANKRRFGLRDGGSCRALPDAPAPPKLRDRTPFGHAHDAAGCI